MADLTNVGTSPDVRKPSEVSSAETKASGWRKWFGRHEAAIPPSAAVEPPQRPGIAARRLSRKVIPGLPRPGTFKRQQSELRDRLEPIQPHHRDSNRVLSSRTRSVDHRCKSPPRSSSQVPNTISPRLSAPGDLGTSFLERSPQPLRQDRESRQDHEDELDMSEQPPEHSPSRDGTYAHSEDAFHAEMLDELEKCWILNLSMHFRDRSNREKFFVTYAENPACWRRITISLDYRDAPIGSLEAELHEMSFQRDKSARIYESIRDSLPDIQFYDTVTNLKLQTENDRLHVHVTEDVHEIINFPSVSSISHLDSLNCPQYCENELKFDSHLSGFVYKIIVEGEVFIKKEIPGPDTVEEFLYEINALYRLKGSNSVIEFKGVVTDNEGKCLRGLLISYAKMGALIDVIYDGKKEIEWARRQRWAKQIVTGLAEIHEGDFTLSNIVIDGNDNAKIIDINRRGCPVGWEPSEIVKLLESKQRISMFISTKTDLFQLGMVLWALAMQLDEPELAPRPLSLKFAPREIPLYYREIVNICLDDDPRKRQHAIFLLKKFPDLEVERTIEHSSIAVEQPGFETQHVDRTITVQRENDDSSVPLEPQLWSRSLDGVRSNEAHTYVNASTSGEPYYYVPRGRSPLRQSQIQAISPPPSENGDDLRESTVFPPRQTSIFEDQDKSTGLSMAPQTQADDRSRTSYVTNSAFSGEVQDDFDRLKTVQQDTIQLTESKQDPVGKAPNTGVKAVQDMQDQDLTGVGLHSSVARYPQALGDDDLT